MKVRDPSGQTWRVTRRWVPWRRRLKGGIMEGPTFPTGLGDDPISMVIGIVCLIIALPFLLLALVAGLELLLLLLVLPFAVLGRVLFGSHWHVELRRGFEPFWEIEAGDWQASKLKIHEIADGVRRGATPEPTVGDPLPTSEQ
jgi:hypothetical protein